MELFSVAGRRKYIMPVAIILLVVLGFIAYKATTKQSPEYTENVEQIKRTIAFGWPIKNLARVEGNKEDVLEWRKKLSEIYSNEEQELTKQQRFITIALDNKAEPGAVPEIYTKYYTDDNVAVVGFNVTGFEFEEAQIKQDRATVKGEVEYSIRRRTLAQEYGTLGSNRYEWQLVKTKGKWLIVKETILTEDEQ
ncbi:MAG: hypothetical protein KGZ93_10115 [Actinobacteria bacterium]|nr:hypothetical protein [Actinomycetota bacterium]